MLELGSEEKAGLAVLLPIALASAFIPYPMREPITVEQAGFYTALAKLITVTVMSVIVAVLAYYVWSLYLRTPEGTRVQVADILLTLAFLEIAFLLGFVRPLGLLIRGDTGARFLWMFLDPVAVAMGSAFLNTAFYFYYLYSRWYSEKEKPLLTATLLIFYAVGNIFIVHPANNYGNAYEPVTFVKVASRVFLLLGILVPVSLMIAGAAGRLKRAEDAVMRARLKLLVVSNVLLILTLILNIADALVATPYSVFVLVAYALDMAGIVGIGIAVLSPRWFVRLVRGG